MSSQYEKLRQRALSQAKQNRTNRVVKSNKHFNKKMSKSQRDYIAGDVLSSASKKAYGYKYYGTPEQSFITGGRSKSNYKAIQEGKNPYEAKYFYDGVRRNVTNKKGEKFVSRKRFLTDNEKEMFKRTGGLDKNQYDSKYKYSVMSSSNKDAKTFKDQLNTRRWDGLEVARNKVNSGSSKLEYLKGGLKDVLVDPVMDALKTFDKYESALWGGAMGSLEESANLFEAIADPNISIKDNVNFNRMRDNFNASIEESNKTGWGKGTADYFDEATKRNIAKERERIKNSSMTDEYKERLLNDLDEKEKSKTQQLFRNIVGFAGDLTNPISLGSAVVKGGKKLVGNTAKSFNDMVKGTADISTAFKSSDELVDAGLKHKDMLERMKAYNKYLQEEYMPNLRKTGSKFDENKAWQGFENSSQAEEYAQKFGYMANNIDQSINHSLDKGFNQAMNKADEVVEAVKTNPKTQNLGVFLENIGKSDNGKQLKIDGRTLNKKYTQVQDGYVPQMLRSADDVDNLANVDKNQLSMFNRNGNTNTYMNNIKPNNKKYSDWYNAYNDEDMLFEMIDDLSDSNADGMLDWLSKNKPDTYARYMGNVDDLDNIANDGIKIFEGTKSRDSKVLGDIARNSDEIKTKPKYDLGKFEQLKEENAIDEILRTIEGNSAKVFNDSYTRNNAFKSSVRDFTDNIMNDDVDLDDLTKTIDDILGSSVPPKVKREFINNKLFGGDEIIKSNASNNELDSLLKSITDIVEVKRAENIRNTTGELIDLNFSDTTKNFFKMLDNEKVNLMSGKIGGVEMNETAEIYEKLSKGINDRSRSLTDSRYTDKLELLAREFGYKNYNNDILASIEKLQEQRKALDKQPLTQEVLNQKLEIASNLKRLKEIQAGRDDLWKQIRNMTEGQFDKFINDNYPQHMKGMSSYSPKVNKTKEIEHLSKDSTINKGFNEVLEKNLNEGVEKRQSKHIDDLESVRSDRRPTDVTKGDETFNESKLLKSVDLEPVIGIPNLAKNYKPTYSHLEKMPGAKHVISNVKKLLTKIVDYDTPVVRKIDGKMQIAPHEFESKILRKELNKQIEIMRKAGIKDYMWFEDIKKFKADLIKNTERGKVDFDELKGVSINRGNKVPDDIRIERDMNSRAKELFIQDEYERILNASNPDELFMSVDYDKYIPKHGDDIGVKLPNKSEHKNLTQLDELENKIKQRANNPLNKYADKLNNDNFELIDKIKSKKQKAKQDMKDVLPIDPETQANMTQTIHRNMDEAKKTGTYKSLDDSKIGTKTSDELLNGDLSPNELAKAIDEDMYKYENPPTFEKFKELIKKDNPKMPYDDSKVYDVYKRWLNSWKKGLTVYNPGWHVQNFFQNKGQNYLALGMDAFGSQKNARKVLDYIQGGSNKAEDLLSKNGRLYTSDEIGDLAQKLGVVNSQTNDVMQSRGIFSGLETAVDNSKFMDKLGRSEETARLHHFITQLKRGMTPEEASKSVNKYLFDYSNKSKLDKVMGDFVDPFWMFHKNNAKLLTGEVINNPSKINNILRGERGLENGIDEQDKHEETWGKFQSPVGSFKDPVNEQMYDYMYKQNMMPRLGEAIPTDRDDFENKLNPLLAIALQQSRGEGNFGNKVVEGKAGWNEVSKEDRNWEIAESLNPFMNLLLKALDKANKHQSKADDGKQAQSTSDKQIMQDWLEYILGHKANYYKRS